MNREILIVCSIEREYLDCMTKYKEEDCGNKITYGEILSVTKNWYSVSIPDIPLGLQNT